MKGGRGWRGQRGTRERGRGGWLEGGERRGKEEGKGVQNTGYANLPSKGRATQLVINKGEVPQFLMAQEKRT